MPNDTRPDWTRLGELLMRRRIELDPRYSNRRIFTDERIPGKYRIVNSVERGKRDNYEPGTIAALEAAYGLEPGAIEQFLDGGELEAQPTRLAVVPAPPVSLERGPGDLFPDIDPEIRPDVDKAEKDIRKLVESARKAGPLTGQRIFGDPHEADRWDWLAELGLSAWQMIRLAAVGRVRDDERRAGQQPRQIRGVLAAT